MKRVDFIRHLQQHGCVLVRAGAKYSVNYNPQARRTSTVPRRKEVKNPTAIPICQQLSVPDPLR